jgi:tetratricopeptide (TPR) repeat protein
VTPDELDHEARAELVSLARPVAERVARHLVATGRLVDEEPERALQHALAARRLAPRIAAVREAVGIAAYQAGDWTSAIAELRAYQRMTGRQTYLAVLADCERALGRPEKAIDLYRSADRAQLEPADAIELLVVASGARRDLGQDEAAVAMLQVRELTQEAPWSARLRYAYADALLGIGRTEEAREWFSRAAEVDDDATTDAAERLLELDGVQLDEAEEPGGDVEEEDDVDEEDEVEQEDLEVEEDLAEEDIDVADLAAEKDEDEKPE